MSSIRHANDANHEALRLHLAIQSLRERAQSGHTVTHEDLTLLLRTSVCVQYQTARTLYAVGQFADRREQVAGAAA